MAADTIPAAVPGPADKPDPNVPSGPSGPVAGMLASMISPVDPARPAFDLAPPGAVGPADAPVTGGSSASYHGSDKGTQQGGATMGSAQKQGIWRAWLLAGATRWGKGGGAQNKRLDLKKAQAQSRQIKETRQVSVNRSGGFPGKVPAASGSGGKSLDSKGNSGGSTKGPKNSSGGVQRGPAGRSGGGGDRSGTGGAGRGPGGAGSAGGKGGDSSPKGPKTGGGHSPQLSKGDTPKAGGAGGGTRGGKNGPQGSAGSAGKDSTGGGSSGKTFSPKDVFSSKGSRKPDSPASKDRWRDRKGAAGADVKTGDPGTSGGPGSATPGKHTKPGQAQGQDSQKKTRGQVGRQHGKPISTRESREAGYRDGTRAARATAHAKAYKDGVKDGWTDTTEAAEREKKRLDKAHAERKKARDKEQPVTGTASSADYHPPQPIGVKDVTGTHVLLGDGALRESLTRGEVRSLKAFERRLEEKAAAMEKAAESTKRLKAHAEAQAVKATQILDASRGVKGGDKLAASLTKLQEAALAQATKADQIHTRAVRAAEAARTVLANAQTRYSAMYQAVVDSPETSPAETRFYLGDHHG